MAYRLAGDRVPLTVDGLVIEVQPIVSDTVYRTVVALGSAFLAEPSTDALERLASYFCIEAQPTWEVVDHRGSVQASPTGLLRFPDVLAVGIVSGWAEAFVAEPPSTAVDEVYPPGPLRDELNRRLRSVA